MYPILGAMVCRKVCHLTNPIKKEGVERLKIMKYGYIKLQDFA